MTTIASLAQEFGAQPEEVAAFADLVWPYDQSAELDTETEEMIREAWSLAEVVVSAATANRDEDRLMDEVADIVDRAGYDY